MMISEISYSDRIKDYSYSELLSEEKRLFKHITELQYKIVSEETHLNTEYINPPYVTQLLSYRKYLIVLQNYILEKENDIKVSKLKESLKDAPGKGE